MAYFYGGGDMQSEVNECFLRTAEVYDQQVTNEMTEEILNLSSNSNYTSSDGSNSETSDRLCGAVGQYFPQLKGNIEKWFSAALHECSSKNLTKQVERTVPSGIFPGDVVVSIVDVSVKARGPDEEKYNKHEVLRKRIPRGLSIIKIRYADGYQISGCVIYANKKFCGSTAEDDDISPAESSSDHKENANKYFLKKPSSASSIIAMEKINGEAAHFSGRFINGQFYLIAGSKNVHLVFQNQDHIDMYTDVSYSIAKPVAIAVLEKWNSMCEAYRSCLAKFLHLTRTTVVCEIMMPGHQHVVNLSMLRDNELVVVALTPPPEEYPTSLTALPSITALQFFSMLGYTIPHYKKLDLSDIDDHILTTRQENNTEGIVYYYEDESSNTIGLVKLKSCWYIHLRALRQQASYRYTARKAPQKSLKESKRRSRHRMEELQKWLYTSDEELEAWKNLSDQWFDWLEKEVTSGNVPPSAIKDNFPTIWHPFSQQNEISNLLHSLNMEELS